MILTRNNNRLIRTCYIALSHLWNWVNHCFWQAALPLSFTNSSCSISVPFSLESNQADFFQNLSLIFFSKSSVFCIEQDIYCSITAAAVSICRKNDTFHGWAITSVDKQQRIAPSCKKGDITLYPKPSVNTQVLDDNYSGLVLCQIVKFW
mgnify:CR=1 FL=1